MPSPIVNIAFLFAAESAPPMYYNCGVTADWRTNTQCPILGYSFEWLAVLRSFLTSDQPYRFNSKRINGDGMSSEFAEISNVSAANECLMPYFDWTESRARLYQATYPFDLRSMIIVVPPAAYLKSSMAFAFVFDRHLWTLILVYFVVAFILTKPTFWLALQQLGCSISFNRHFLWLGLSSALILALYRSSLLAQLFSSKEKFLVEDFNSMVELIGASDVQLVVVPNTSYSAMANNEPSLRNALDSNPALTAETENEMMGLVAHSPNRNFVAFWYELYFLYEAVHVPQLAVVHDSTFPLVPTVVFCSPGTRPNVMKALNTLILEHQTELVGVKLKATARNFNPVMAKAARCTIAEVEEIVEVGELDANFVHTPAVYVDRVLLGTDYKKPIEKIVNTETIKASQAASSDADKIRITVARRAALELKDGMTINLGIGMPMLVPTFVSPDTHVMIQSENGIVGLGGYPVPGQEDADLINAGKETVTAIPGATYLDSNETFAMIRGGHLAITMLGSMQVAANGDMANWMIPAKKVKGMGGAMDLVAAPGIRVIVTMQHCAKGGKPKILEECTLPLTGTRCVDMIITEMAVFKVDKLKGVLKLTEVAEGYTVEDVVKATEAEFVVSRDLRPMQQAPWPKSD